MREGADCDKNSVFVRLFAKFIHKFKDCIQEYLYNLTLTKRVLSNKMLFKVERMRILSAIYHIQGTVYMMTMVRCRITVASWAAQEEIL